MVDSPCSRIGHIYKSNPFPDPRGYDYVSKNFKRVAEVICAIFICLNTIFSHFQLGMDG